MTLHIPDFVRVTINGTDRTAYVISYNRHSTLCEFSDTFTFEISFKIPSIPDPYDTVIIRELYNGQNEKIISGYIIDVIQDFDSGSYTINGQDRTLLLDDFFIHTQTFANNENVAFWINFYADSVGLDVQYDSSVTQFIVDEGTPMGMITAAEGLALLERLAAVYIKYDAEIDKLRVFRINTSEPVIQVTDNETTKFSREIGTDKTRNVVKVYGGFQSNIFTGATKQVFAKAITNLEELITDKTVVVSNPFIKQTPIAQIIATRILQIVNDVDDVLNIETAGFYPQVEVGEYIGINIGTGVYNYIADREVTSIQTTLNSDGAVTIFTVGEKCPRISIMPPVSVVYATATNAGVLVSWDAGDTFDPFNRGIISPTNEIASGINGTSIAANKYGQLMAIIDNNLYKRTGKFGSWTDLSAFLPDPSNDEGEQQFGVTDLQLVKVEKESNDWGRFHFLANITSSGGIVPSGQERWWIYWTPDYGVSWDNMQMYVPGSGVTIGAASGLPANLINGIGITHSEMQAAAALSGSLVFNVDVKDIESGKSGDVTVLVQGEPKFFIPEDTVGAETFYVGRVHVSESPQTLAWSFINVGTWYMDGYDQDNQAQGNKILGTSSFIETNSFNIIGPVNPESALFAVPNDRSVAYYSCVAGVVTTARISRTTGGYIDRFPGPGESDVPDWEYIPSAEIIMAGANPVGFYLFYDYSSLKGDSTLVRWAIVHALPRPGEGAGDDWPSNSGFDVTVTFFEDDISVDPSSSCTTKQEKVLIGRPEGTNPGSRSPPLVYGADGLFGYTARPSTVSPVPRLSQWGGGVASTVDGGASVGAMTRSKTGGNTAYILYLAEDGGQWHGDDRDPGWPGIQHPRDFEESLNLGFFVIEIDLTNQVIKTVRGRSVDLAQHHTNPPTDDAGILDYTLNATLFRLRTITPNELWIRHRWIGHGDHYEFWMSYPGFGILEKVTSILYPTNLQSVPGGVLKVPFYDGSMIAEYSNLRQKNNGPPPFWEGSTSFFNRSEVSSWRQINNLPVSPSGQIVLARQHPSFGICVNEQRGMKVGRGPSFDDEITNWDYDFMWKSQRASNGVYVVQGSAQGILDPYTASPPIVGRTNESQGRLKPFSWDFRTAAGSFGLENGGSSGVWNFLD